jgi:DNA mismatch repair protein MutS
MKALTKQYQQIKTKYPDAILLFRVGDHYEIFYEDAKILAAVMGITLQQKEENDDIKEAASLPFHCLDAALHALVRQGYKVAVCEELEGPKRAKGNAKRGVTDLL